MATLYLNRNKKGTPTGIQLVCDFTDNYLAKSIEGKRWDSAANAWVYPLQEQIVDEIRSKFLDVYVSESLQKWLDHEESVRATAAAIHASGDFNLTLPIRSVLRPFQRVGVGFMLYSLKEHGAVLLADDMGLGKTLESIVAIEEFVNSNGNHDAKTLIVSPSSVKWGWESEFKIWARRMQEVDGDKKFSNTIDRMSQVSVVDGSKTNRDKALSVPASYYVINYEAIPHTPKLLDMHFDFMVVDEAHRIKNRKSQISGHIGNIKADLVVLSTATPIMNRAEEIWALLHRMFPHKYTSFWRFVGEYCDLEHTRFGTKIGAVKNPAELKSELGMFMIRREKKDVLTELPPKIYQSVFVDLEHTQSVMYNQMRDNMIAEIIHSYDANPAQDEFGVVKTDTPSFLDQVNLNSKNLITVNSSNYGPQMRDQIVQFSTSNGLKIDEFKLGSMHNMEAVIQSAKDCLSIPGPGIVLVVAPEMEASVIREVLSSVRTVSVLSQITRLRQIAISAQLIDPAASPGSPKIDSLMDMLPDYIESEHKVVIFSNFSSALRIVEDRLNKKKIKFLSLTGDTSKKDRPTIVSRFQEDPDMPVFLSTIQAGGVGLNLTSADTVFFLDRHWTPTINSQAEDRLYRMGQKNTVNVVDFIANNTIEKYIWHLLQVKKDIFESVMSMKDIVALLEGKI